jgi:two-component sensor histidine kinase
MEEMLRESINRIIAIAAVHDLLSREELDQVNLKGIAETILTLTGRSLLDPARGVRMRVVGDDISLPSSKAATLALILKVQIAREGPSVRVELLNDGDPLPPDFDPRQSESLGLQIVLSLAQNDLAGRFLLQSGERTRAAVVFNP